MTEGHTFNEYLNLTLQLVLSNKIHLVSIIAPEDFLHLIFSLGSAAFQPPKNIRYNSLGANLWVQLLKTYGLTEKARQISDPEFAQILNRIRGSSHTDPDVKEIKFLSNTYTSHWPNGFVKIYLTIHLFNLENEKKRIEKLRSDLGRDVICVYAKDSARDAETQTLFVDVSDNQIHKTSYFLPKLKVFIN